MGTLAKLFWFHFAAVSNLVPAFDVTFLILLYQAGLEFFLEKWIDPPELEEVIPKLKEITPELEGTTLEGTKLEMEGTNLRKALN